MDGFDWASRSRCDRWSGSEGKAKRKAAKKRIKRVNILSKVASFADLSLRHKTLVNINAVENWLREVDLSEAAH